jgi:hypothetical protein
MFGGLTKTSSRIAIAAALGMTLGGFAMSAHPAKAADLGGDCCADLEERVAELEATTVRKGNKKVSVTLSGWVVKYGAFWDDGKENNFYVGDKHTTLSSHFTISGQATIAPGWTGGYNLTVEVRGGNAVGDDNQFNENSTNGVSLDILGNTSALLSYMWIKSDKYGTVNWGELSQATDNVALLPDLSGTIIESNAVLFDGQAFFIRPKGAKNANDMTSDFTWGSVVNCLSAGGGIGADCNGYPENGVRYDSPTFSGFSVSGGVYEDKVKDIAVKYAADWNSIKFAAAFGFSNVTDEGCTGNSCGNLVLQGGGGQPFQGFRRDADVWQVGASVMHVPSGLWAYGLWQQEDNNGTQWQNLNFGNPTNPNGSFNFSNSAANQTDVWFAKAGIKRTWTPLGATVIWGEGGQYHDMFNGLCNTPGELVSGNFNLTGNSLCTQEVAVPGQFFKNGQAVTQNAFITGSDVNRWGAGIMQEIDSAAMHVWFNWQHLELNIDAVSAGCGPGATTGCIETASSSFGKHISTSYDSLDIFMLGGVIFF